jgi:hypothetical protein
MGYKIIKIFPDVMSDPRLRSLEEKIIVCHILGFQREDKCVFSTDSHIGFLIARSENETRELILSLAKRGIIKLTYPTNGTARFISIKTPDDTIQCGDDTDIFEL